MRTTIAALALLVSTSAHAEFYTGNDILRFCESSSPMDTGACFGYIAGATDTLTRVTVCPPQTVTLGQVKDIVVRALKEMPQIRHHTADQIVNETLKRVWPCQQQNPARNSL